MILFQTNIAIMTILQEKVVGTISAKTVKPVGMIKDGLSKLSRNVGEINADHKVKPETCLMVITFNSFRLLKNVLRTLSRY